MLKLDYQELCDIYREEKSSNSLQPLAKDFETSLALLFSQIQITDGKGRIYENAKHTALALNRLRKQKIMMRSLVSLSSSEMSALTQREDEYYNKLKEINQRQQKELESTIFSLQTPAEPQKKDIKSIKKIKILKDVPAYRGADSKDYGPYSQGQIVEIALREAEWMIKSQLAKDLIDES
jgi:DNA replication initiation complex subunit (GINS family)